MPNNFVFNQSPQDFKTQIYGKNGNELAPIVVSSDGGISASITNIPSVLVNNIPSVLVNNIPSVLVNNIPSVLVNNTPSVLVNNIPSVLVNNTPSVLVENIPSVLVNNIPSVLVNNIPSVLVNNIPSVMINNIASVEIHSVLTTSDVATVTSGTGAATILAENTSMQKEYSYYINNLGGSAFTVVLQVAPLNVNALYIGDTSTFFNIPANTNFVIAPLHYLNWTRLWYDTGSTGTPSFAAYYNAKI